MRKAVRLFLVATVSFSVGLCAAVAAGPGMNVGWENWNTDQDACVKRASDKMRSNGFTNIEVVGHRTIYGERGAYTAAIRCVAEKHVAFFAVSGPESKLCGEYNDKIKEGF